MFQLTRAFTRRVESQHDEQPVQEVGRLRQSRPHATADIPKVSLHSGWGAKSYNCSRLLAVLACRFILYVTSLTLPGTTHAQVLYGSLTGNVTDSAGGGGAAPARPRRPPPPHPPHR